MNTTDTYPFTRPSLINATQLQGINDDGDGWNPNPKPFHLSDDYQIKIPVGPNHLVNFNGSTYQSKDTLPENNFEGQGEQQFRRQTARLKNFQSPSSFSPITARFASNFLVDADPAVDPVLQTDIMQGSIEQLSVSTQGDTVNIGPGRGGIRYASSYTGRQVQRDGSSFKWGKYYIGTGMGFYDDKDVFLTPNELEDFAEKYMVDEKRVMILDVDEDGKPITGRNSGQILSDKSSGIEGFSNTYTDYIQAMSPGRSQPFIVRKIGDQWGLDTTGVDFFDGVGNFIGELAGGFMRTTGSPFDSITGRIGREIADVVRKGKYLLTSDGLTFGIQQLLLNASNRTIETRLWNPLSLASNDFYHLNRHAGSTYEESIDGIGGAVTSALPKALGTLVSTLGIGKADKKIGKGRIINQVLWTKGSPAGDTAKNIKIRLYNPNHAFRLTTTLGPFDPYKSPPGQDDVGTGKGAESFRKTLEGGGEGKQYTKTFASEPSKIANVQDGGSVGAQYNFKTYGQIPTDSDDPGFYEKEIESPSEQIKKTDVETAPQIRNKSVFEPDIDGELTLEKLGGISKEEVIRQVQSANGTLNNIDPVNSRPLSEVDGGPTEKLDFVLFKFNTLAYIDNVAQARTLQFRAILNGINESVTPEYQEQRYLGRPDKYYTYNGVDRDVSLEFTLYPKTAKELPFLSEKLNYLVGLTYPQYTEANFMIAPFTEITLGDMFKKQPGYISSLNITVQDNTTWEIDVFQFPKHITANLTYRVIGRHLPHTFGKHYDIPWLQKNEDGYTLRKVKEEMKPGILRKGDGPIGKLTSKMDTQQLSQEAS